MKSQCTKREAFFSFEIILIFDRSIKTIYGKRQPHNPHDCRLPELLQDSGAEGADYFHATRVGCLPIDRLGSHSWAGWGGVAKLLQRTATEAKRGRDWFHGYVQHVHWRRLGEVLHWRSGYHALHKCYDYSAVDEPYNPKTISPITRGGWAGEDHADWPGDDTVSLSWPNSLCNYLNLDPEKKELF